MRFEEDVVRFDESRQSHASFERVRADSIIGNLKDKLNDLQASLTKATRKIEKREEKIFEYEKELALWREEAGYWKDRAATKEEELHRCRQILIEKSKEISLNADYRTEYTLLKTQLHSVEAMNDQLHTQLAEQVENSQAAARQSQEIDGLEIRACQAEEEVQRLRSTMANLEAVNAKLDTEIQWQKSNQNKLSGQLQTAQSESDVLRAENKDLLDKLVQREQYISGLNSKEVKTKTQSEKRIKRLEDSVENLLRVVDANSKENAQLLDGMKRCNEISTNLSRIGDKMKSKLRRKPRTPIN